MEGIFENHVQTKKYTENLENFYNIDDAVNAVGYGKFQIRLLFLAGLGWIADAIEIMILSLIGEYLSCSWTINRWQNALLTSVVFVGISLGSPVFGAIADIYGRKKALSASFVLVFIFGCLSAASPSYVWILIFRMLMGFALAGIAQGLTLCCEYVPTESRGKTGFYLCYFWSIGTVGVVFLAWGVMITLDNWRILLFVASLPSFIAIVALKWYPESARYFLVSNQYEKANKILEKMAFDNNKSLPCGKLMEVKQHTKRGRVQDLLSKDYRKMTLLFWYLMLASAFSYYGIVLISPTIIQNGSIRNLVSETGTNQTQPGLINNWEETIPCVKLTQQNYIDLLWTSAAEFPGLLLFSFLVEHIGRKVLLSISCITSSILVFLLLLNTQIGILPLVFLFGARALLLAIFQLVYIMTTESFPTTLRSIALGSSSAFARIGGLVIPYAAQVLIMTNPVITILLLGGVILIAGFVALCLPLETRGAVMEELHISKK